MANHAQALIQQIDTLDGLGMITYEPKEFVTKNLNNNIELRPYQKKAVSRFEYYFNGFPQKKNPIHL